MMGYEMSWASFNIIEVMASTKFTEKRIGFSLFSYLLHVSCIIHNFFSLN